MKPGEIEKLLGGYATGTLTGDEEKLLFEAALHDQNLFDALAHEQSLKDVFDDPVSRQALLASLNETAPAWKERYFGWLRRPWPLAFAGVAALATLTVAVLVNVDRHQFYSKEAAAVPQHADQVPASAKSKQVEPPPSLDKAESKPLRAKKIPSPDQPKEVSAQPRKLESPPAAPITESTPVPESRRSDKPASAAGTVIADTRAKSVPAPTDSSLKDAKKETDAKKEEDVAGARRETETAKSQLARPASAFAPPVMKAPAPAPQYEILKVGADGNAQDVSRQTIFNPGDLIRLRIIPAENGYLHVVRRSDGVEQQISSADAPYVNKGVPYVLPATGAIQLGPQSGDVEFQIVIAAQPRDTRDFQSNANQVTSGPAQNQNRGRQSQASQSQVAGSPAEPAVSQRVRIHVR